ncbi:MAG: hypothetical protein KGZ34_06315 [Nitrosarchaeum sp.]|nr:hypothetical protein [Nitrosarchaeum sp.]
MWDNTWKKLLKTILNEGHEVKRKDSKRNIRELIGHSFYIENPLERLLCDEVRGLNIFQCVGQFLWITQGNFNLEAIKYYQPLSEKFSSDGVKMIGSYGPRLFGIQHLGQMDHLINVLAKDPSKRRAVASIYLPQFDQHGLSGEEVPCTLNLQYLIRDNNVQSVTYMRSQDVFKVMPYDIFLFTMLQEYVMNQLKPEYSDFSLGRYNHFSGSFHIYESDIPQIEKVIGNSSSCGDKMPEMPSRDVKIRLRNLNKFESTLRTMTSAKIEFGVDVNYSSMLDMLEKLQKDEYWKQMGLILIAYSAIKTKNNKILEQTYNSLCSTYQHFIDVYQEKTKITT